MKRLREANAGKKPWRRWGTYVSERQWGTVREDYSANGDAWNYFPHDHARSRAYRWGEDGIGGFCDERQTLCLGIALWNGADPILKERLFGLTNGQGNHGEDVKEIYYYLDATPTYSYARMLYKYPQAAFPYQRLIDENARRGKLKTEFELIDTGIFNDDAYFDIDIQYAKADVDDILLQITATNRGRKAARLTVLPQVWFRNTWTWFVGAKKPSLTAAGDAAVAVAHASLGDFTMHLEKPQKLLFCDNETNTARLYHSGGGGFFKDAFHNYVVHGDNGAVNPAATGTKAAGLYAPTIPAGGKVVIRVRLSPGGVNPNAFADFDQILQSRIAEADSYYDDLQKNISDIDARRVQRQALGGMLWSKQFYAYDVAEWL
ncbi:MAG: MGH1-like glycoside hydrolase domain-containing protein, partial [Rhodoplanes sp.]